MTGEARETAGLTTKLIVRYVRACAGEPGVEELLAVAGETRPVSELEDEHSWSSDDQTSALFEAAARICRDPSVARRVGESVLSAHVGLPVRMLLWTLGSPARVFREVGRTSAKFSTVATLSCLEAGPATATVTSEMDEGYRQTRYGCDYTRGLLSQVPALFGMPPGAVEHEACQVDGAPRCVYRVRWTPRSRLVPWSRRRTVAHLEEELQVLMHHVEVLHQTATDLVAAADVPATLLQIARRAASAVRAGAYQVAVRPIGASGRWVHSEGLTDADAAALADRLLADAAPSGDGLLVADVASARRFYGRIAAVYPRGQSFFPEEQRLLDAYAGMAATALDAAASRETSEVLLALARSLADIGGVEEVCERVASAVPSLVDAPQAAVALWAPDAREMSVRAVLGLGDMTAAVESLVVRPEDTPQLELMLRAPRTRSYDATTDDPFIRAALEAFGVGSVSVVPILRRGEFFGAVVVGWRRPVAGRLDDEVEQRLAGLAAQAATALDNARLLEQATHQALHDPLTGLPNRLLLQDRVFQAAARARRQSTSVALLLLDLDDFKSVNDILGHAAGDRALCEVAGRLKGLLRQMDTAARLGGDEFVVICQDIAGEREALDLTSRVEAALRQPFELEGRSVVIGASIGCTLIDGTVGDVGELLAAADRAMYRVKRGRSGRQLETSVSSPPPE